MGSNLYKLRSFGYVEIDDEIWFPNLNFNALMKINKLTGRLEIVDKFPNYGVWQGWLYSTVCHVNGYLVFVPNESEEVVTYHIETRKFISTPLDHDFIGRKKTYFVNAYVYKHYVYMFPMGAECIVRYDSIKHTIKYLENDLSILIRSKPQTFYCFYQQFELIDQKIYFPFLELNAVAIFDLDDESVEIKYLDITGGCSTIKYTRDRFYLSSWESRAIYSWDYQTGDIKTYQGVPEGFAEEQKLLYACDVGDALVFFPAQGSMIISFSPKSGEIHTVQEIQNFDKEPIETYFVEENEKKEHVLILTADREFISSCTCIEKSVEVKPYCQFDNSYNKKQIDDFLFFEDGKLLEEYIAEVLENCENAVQIEVSCNYGKKIFDRMRIS